MAKSETIFQRYEYKYLITVEKHKLLMERLGDAIIPDEYGESTILSLYYDTPQKRLIRRSLEQPIYKEKLRLRSYGVAGADTKVYVEIKKKYDGVVYKRRVGMKAAAAREYLAGGAPPKRNQITNEIDYFLKFYQNLEPSMMLSYDRTAYMGKEDNNLRITFDRNILYREEDLTVESPVYGKEVIPKGMVLLELKVAGAIPLWLTTILSDLGIYKSSFSKYGTAYKLSLQGQNERTVG